MYMFSTKIGLNGFSVLTFIGNKQIKKTDRQAKYIYIDYLITFFS